MMPLLGSDTGLELTFGEIYRPVATRARVGSIEFVRKDLFLFPTLGAFADER